MIGLFSCCCGASSVRFVFSTAFVPSYGHVGLLLDGSDFSTVFFPDFEYVYLESSLREPNQNIIFSLDFDDKETFKSDFIEQYNIHVKDKFIYKSQISSSPILYEYIALSSSAEDVYDFIMNALNSINSGFCCA